MWIENSLLQNNMERCCSRKLTYEIWYDEKNVFFELCAGFCRRERSCKAFEENLDAGIFV